MKKFLRVFPVVVLALFAGVYSGCEWEADSDNAYNTSQWSGVELNFSGQYVARTDGGELVTGRPDITYFLITQTGNRLDVLDNLGTRYEGSTGTPAMIAEPLEVGTDGTPRYPEGALMSLMNFTFRNEGSAASIHDDVIFEGFLRFLSITDIEGSTSTTELNIDADPVTIQQTSYTEYQADRSNSMMVLEGQWREGSTIRYVDGWSNNFMVFWANGHQHGFEADDGIGADPAADAGGA